MASAILRTCVSDSITHGPAIRNSRPSPILTGPISNVWLTTPILPARSPPEGESKLAQGETLGSKIHKIQPSRRAGRIGVVGCPVRGAGCPMSPLLETWETTKSHSHHNNRSHALCAPIHRAASSRDEWEDIHLCVPPVPRTWEPGSLSLITTTGSATTAPWPDQAYSVPDH